MRWSQVPASETRLLASLLPQKVGEWDICPLPENEGSFGRAWNSHCLSIGHNCRLKDCSFIVDGEGCRTGDRVKYARVDNRSPSSFRVMDSSDLRGRDIGK